MTSNTKRIINELSTLETESASIVPSNYCYILKIKVCGPHKDSLNSACNAESKSLLGSLNKIAESLLLTDPAPSSVYYSRDILLLIFSAAQELSEENTAVTHQLDGNHNLIVSRYCVMLARLLPTVEKIDIRIVHLSSKTAVFSYLSYIIFTEYQESILLLSKGKITNKDLNFRTDNELRQLLITKCNVNLDDEVPPENKYGVLLRAKRIKNKANYVKMSELFDARDTKKYISFIFG
jgi:hypothetical protein